MVKIDYNNLKQQVEEQYQKTLIIAEKRRKEAIKAIEQVLILIQDLDLEEPASTDEKVERLFPKTNKSSYGSLTAAVKQALKHVKAKFTKNDIMLVITQTDREFAKSINQGSLAGCLMRFVKQGIIKIHKRGKGSHPTIYKKMKT